MRILLFLLFFTSLQSQSNYNSLQNLFIEWRKFENPSLLNGAPDYTKKGFNKRKSAFNTVSYTHLTLPTTPYV